MATLEEKVAVYEHVLHQIQMYREVVMSHEKVVELLDIIGNWSYAHRCGNGEYSWEEQEQIIGRQFDRLKAFPNKL